MTIFMLYIDLLLLLTWSKNGNCRIFCFNSSYLNKTARYFFICEPPQVKTSKTVCTASKDTDQPGHPPYVHRERMGKTFQIFKVCTYDFVATVKPVFSCHSKKDKKDRYDKW